MANNPLSCKMISSKCSWKRWVCLEKKFLITNGLILKSSTKQMDGLSFMTNPHTTSHTRHLSLSKQKMSELPDVRYSKSGFWFSIYYLNGCIHNKRAHLFINASRFIPEIDISCKENNII